MEFKFKGISSLKYNLIFDIVTYPLYEKPKFIRVEIPGRHGDIKRCDGFESVPCEIDILVRGSVAQRITKINELKSWLTGQGTLELEGDTAREMVVIDFKPKEKYRFYEVITVDFESV